ncbi:hypothetical protein [Acidovorax sp. SUPP3334]|uniref:hypothetical protein n=1 Tax=Acidovorax sp. SUPP3334 TaxID=2920881 RepID=UPI0023DE658B|nr:hypothetical protein [Acidovorax sp. SUPP3334]GKT25871.1 transposase [Acidovorax sp. SUPP3334]
MPSHPFWVAQRHDQSWNDESVLSAINWLVSFVEHADWSRRLEAVRSAFRAAQQPWAGGGLSPLFDPQDAMVWYVFQANAYACSSDREDWFEPASFRIAPLFRQLGQLLPLLQNVTGIGERIERLMTSGRSQPDQGLFELLVAGAYRCRGWKTIEFVRERPGIAKTHEFNVTAGRRKWAVECKRANRSGYEAQEYVRGQVLAKQVHDLCRMRNCSLVLEVVFKVELSEIDDDYLLSRSKAFLKDSRRARWVDPQSHGQVRHVDWRLAQAVLEYDDVFFGSSRMIELLVGAYAANADHTVEADWTPARRSPLHATAMSRASVVSWRSASEDAARRKARHFKSMVAEATQQLPDDRPGVIHVGYEARDGNSVDKLRHELNAAEMLTFEPRGSRLRWVYGNYLSPEHTNAPNESCALSETTATYKIGKHRTPLRYRVIYCLMLDKAGLVRTGDSVALVESRKPCHCIAPGQPLLAASPASEPNSCFLERRLSALSHINRQ